MQISKVKVLIPAPENGDDAVYYYIQSTVLTIDADKDGVPTNPDQNITLTKMKRVGKNAAAPTTDLTILVYKVKDGSGIRIGRTTAASFTFPASNASGMDYIRAELRSAADPNTVIASQEIIVNKKGQDGNDGQNGVTYEIVPGVANIRADKDGNILTGAIRVSAYKTEAGIRTSCGLGRIIAVGIDDNEEDTPHYWAQYRIDSGSWTDCSNISIGIGMMAEMGYGVPGSAVSTITSGIAFRLLYGTTSSNSVVHETAALQVVRNGSDGERGKAGRFYYYDGYFVSTKEYTADDYKAPYVAFDWTDNTDNGPVIRTSYYMLIANTNKKNSVLVAPRTSAASGVWEQMTTDFRYMITEAFFSAFAKLGSWVFNGDFMMSQQGIDGTRNFQNFTDENGSWMPNILLNAATGGAILNDVTIRGNGFFCGLMGKVKTIVTSDNLSQYSQPSGLGDDDLMIDFEKTGTYIEFRTPIYGILPSERKYIGTNLIIVNNSGGLVALTGTIMKTDDGSGNSYSLQNGKVWYIECKARANPYGSQYSAQGVEQIYWLIKLEAPINSGY